MMRISTKGRYALRIMIDLAKHAQDGPVSLRGIAERQMITNKYMEGIMALLLHEGMLTSTRGKMGGYRLAREPQEYTVFEILNAAEGSLAPVQCLTETKPDCPLVAQCVTLPVWRGLDQVVREYLEGVTLADLISKGDSGEPCQAV